MGVLPGVAAAVAAVAVVAGGFGLEMNKHHGGTAPTNHLTTASNHVQSNSVQANNTTQPSTTTSSTFQQTFKSSGSSNQVYLSPSIGFQITNLGGGMSNFEYEFSKTTDGGKTWTKISKSHYSHVSGVSFINDKTGYLINNSPAYSIMPDLFVTHDGGATWNEQKLPIPSAYKNYYRSSNYPIFFSPKVGFIPVYGQSMKVSSSTQFLYMLVTTDGGASWTTDTNNQGGGLTWKVSGQKLSVSKGTQTITVNGLFSNWTVSTIH